jgi:hypothetical protein
MAGICICRKANNENERFHVMGKIFNELHDRESENRHLDDRPTLKSTLYFSHYISKLNDGLGETR